MTRETGTRDRTPSRLTEGEGLSGDFTRATRGFFDAIMSFFRMLFGMGGTSGPDAVRAAADHRHDGPAAGGGGRGGGPPRMTSEFGFRSLGGRHAHHDGVDMAMASGTQLRAQAGGRVAFAGWAGGYGNTVIIDHGNGVLTLYGHLSNMDVRTGDQVRDGQVFARSGNTGRSTGAHLHYEVMVQDRGRAYNIDPQKYNLDDLIANRGLQMTAKNEAIRQSGEQNVASRIFDTRVGTQATLLARNGPSGPGIVT